MIGNQISIAMMNVLPRENVNTVNFSVRVINSQCFLKRISKNIGSFIVIGHVNDADWIFIFNRILEAVY